MTTVTIGRRLVPLEHIALIEPFDAAAQMRMQSDRSFLTRVVMIDRESVLTEEPLATFAEKHRFRVLGDDGIATNPTIRFSVEAFEPAEEFKPTKPFRSRLLWRDQNGQMHSKLLLSAPENVLAVAVRGESKAPSSDTLQERKPRPSPRRRGMPTPR
jgi:hypothetical protein